MRRLLVFLMTFAVIAGVSTPVSAQDVSASTFEQLTVADTAVNLDASTVIVNGRALARCVGVLETAAIRIRVDGTAATASIGQLVPVGALVDIVGSQNIRRFSAIRTGGTSGVLPMTCYPSPAELSSDIPMTVTPTPAVSAAGLSTDGTVSLPGQAFASDPDSGLYRIGANNLGIAVAGAKVVDVASTGISVAGQVLPRESFIEPLMVFEQDFSPKVLTDGATNYVLGSPLGLITYREELGKTASSWIISATNKLDITADDTTDDEGVEVVLGDGLVTDASAWLTTGTTGGCFEVNFTVALIAGTDQFVIGWRQNEAFRSDNVYTGYADWSVVGINNVDGSVFSLGEVAGAGTISDDSGTNAANAGTYTLKSCINASTRVPTAYLDGTAITMTSSGTAKTAARKMNPFISYLQAGGAVDAGITVNWMAVTR